MASQLDQNRSFIWKLQRAITNKDITTAKRILKGGIDINALYWGGIGCMHEAILSDHVPMVKMLIQAGANVNLQTVDGRTPLHYACRSGNEDVIDALLNAKCNVNIQTEDGKTPLHVALWKHHAGIIRKLLEYGADPNIQDGDGWTALHWAAHQNFAQIMKLLIQKGANMVVKAKDGSSPLSMSLRTGSWSCVRILIFHGAGDIPQLHDDAMFDLGRRVTFKEEDLTRHMHLLHKAGLRRLVKKKLIHLIKPAEDDYEYGFTLSSICRTVIRNTLNVNCGGRCILGQIDSLEIPSLLRDYLKMTKEFEGFESNESLETVDIQCINDD